VNRVEGMPFGPEFKDPMWRWASFLVGVDTFIALLALATLGGIMLMGFWWFLTLVLGILLSWRSGKAWRDGIQPERHFAKVIQPTVDVKGQQGSTYVLLEPARGSKGVRPREFGPFWWSLYSVFVRAPVALGDVVLTVAWRLLGGFRNGSSSAALARFQMDRADNSERLPPPDQDVF